MSPYSIGQLANRLYVSGYPTSQIFKYDFSRPLGLRQEPPNPRRIGWAGKADAGDMHVPLTGTVGAADGRVYTAGCTVGRRREGGGFGWYDTKTCQDDGMSLDEHRIFWIATAPDGRYVLMSSKRQGKGMLLCWDTRKHEFVYKKEILEQPTPGPIVEALPGGLVIGHTTAPGDQGGTLYGLKADTGELPWTKRVRIGPVTAFSRVRRHAYSYRRGPDGRIWSFFDNTLVRIDPVDGKVEAVGRVPDHPVQIAFAAGHVYAAGSGHPRRVKGLRTD